MFSQEQGLQTERPKLVRDDWPTGWEFSHLSRQLFRTCRVVLHPHMPAAPFRYMFCAFGLG
jgi:hypothetical protein